MIFLWPAMSYIRLRPEPIKSVTNILPIVTIVMGAIFIILGIWQIILHLVEGINCSGGEEMEYCLSTNASASSFLSTTVAMTTVT